MTDPVVSGLMNVLSNIIHELGDSNLKRLKEGVWPEDEELAPSIGAFLKVEPHGKTLKFAASAARWFEAVAIAGDVESFMQIKKIKSFHEAIELIEKSKTPTTRKGPCYRARLWRAMEIPAIEQYTAVARQINGIKWVSEDAIRLVGAAYTRYLDDHVKVEFVRNNQYKLPPKIQAEKDWRVARFKSEHTKWHDGTIAGLTGITKTEQAQSEQQHLLLTMRPVKWFDYSVAEEYANELRMLPRRSEREELAELVDLNALSRLEIAPGNKLPNPCGACITLISSDAYMLLTVRVIVSTSWGTLNASVSENIRVESGEDANGLVVPSDIDAQGNVNVFDLARRGIERELSPSLLGEGIDLGLSLLGIAFVMDTLDSPLLFLAEVDKTQQQIDEHLHLSTGVEFDEGNCFWVPIDSPKSERRSILSSGGGVLPKGISANDTLEGILKRNNWHASGRASIRRALEFRAALKDLKQRLHQGKR